MLIRAFLNKITMYQAMLYLLRGLIGTAVVFSFFDYLPYTWWHILANLGILIAACVLFNKIFSAIFRVRENYESQYITAEILTLIVGPVNPRDWEGILLLVVVSAIAMASKYILVFRKRHIFNPAAIGVLASAYLINQGASWWIGSQYMQIFIVIGGLLMLYKLRWFHLAFSFLATYLLAFGILLFMDGLALPFVIESIKSVLIYSSLLFFTFVMLIEPLTAPPTHKLKVYYGISIGLILALSQKYLPAFPYSFEGTLLLGNLLFMFTHSSRINMVLVEKQEVAKNIFSFWFEPVKKIDFQPGQFMEWRLPHHKADTRGTRRWFTIAASPTENNLMITTKIGDKNSSFKQALAKMNKGDEIIAAALDGEFVLPSNPSKKIVFIAGGIGITPFRSIIKYLVDKKENRNVVLMYAAKTADEFVFRELFTQAQTIGLKTIYLETDKTGYLTAEMIKKDITDYLERIFYVSGPEPMVESYKKILQQAGVGSSNIKTDFFPGYEA